MSSPEVRPKLSVVVVCCAMATQIKNTLQSLVPPFQRNISIGEYEVIMSCDLFSNVDGVDKQSRVPAGGLTNLDFFAREVTAENSVSPQRRPNPCVLIFANFSNCVR